MIIELFDYLTENNINVFLISQPKGNVTSPYVILKDAGTIGMMSNKVGTQLIDVIFYLPQNQFTKCEPYKKQVMELIKEFNKLRYTGEETPIISDDDVKGLTFSVMYQNFKIIGV